MMSYRDDLWRALRAEARWARTCAGPLAPNAEHIRLSVRREVETEWRWRSGEAAVTCVPLQRCRAHERMGAEIHSVTLSEDGQRLVITGEGPSTLQVWTAESPHVLTHCVRGRPIDRFNALLLPPPLPPRDIDPGSPRLVPSARASTSHLCWRALSQDRRKERGILYLWAVRPTEGRAADGTALRSVRAKSRADGEAADEAENKPTAKLVGHRQRVSSASLNASKSVLATVDELGEFFLWDLRSDEPTCIGKLAFDEPLEAIAMGDGTRLFACGTKRGGIRLLVRSSGGGGGTAPMSPPMTPPASPAHAAEAGSGDGGEAAVPQLTFIRDVYLEGHTDWVTHLEICCAEDADTSRRDGDDTCGGDTSRAKLSPRRFARPPSGAAASGTWRLLLSGSRDHTVRVWSLREDGRRRKYGECLHVLHGHSRWLTSLAIGFCRAMKPPPPAPSSSYAEPPAADEPADGVDPRLFLVSASADGSMRVWRLSDGASLGMLSGHERSVTDLVLCGTRLVSGSMDKSVRAWELEYVLTKTVPTPADVQACLDHQQHAPMLVDTEHSDFVRCVGFDHKKIVSCGDDGKVVVRAF